MGKYSDFARIYVDNYIFEIISSYGGEETYHSYVDPPESKTMPHGHIMNIVSSLKLLSSEAKRLYGTSVDRTANLTPDMLSHMINLYQRAIVAIGSFYGENVITQSFDLHKGAQDVANDLFHDSADLDKCELLNNLNAELRDVENFMHELQKNSIPKESIYKKIAELTKGISADKHPAFIEHPEFISDNSIIPECIQSDGNIREITEFYMLNEKNLNADEKAYLQARIQNIYYLDCIAASKKDQPKKLARMVKLGKKGILMPDIGLYNNQLSGNGCWSCSYQLLLQSRGIFIDQKDIRSYRPALNRQAMMNVSHINIQGIVEDKVNSPLEFPDLVTDLLPNTAMGSVHLSIDNNPSAADKARMETDFKAVVQRALYKYNSPVSLTNGSHFTTIIGMDDDGNYLIRDSMDGNTDIINVKSFSDIYDGSLYARKPEGVESNLELIFLKDINPKEPFPKGFERIKYSKDGVLNTQGKLDADANALTQVKGEIFVNNIATKSEKYRVSESFYVPHQLVPYKPLVMQTIDEDKTRSQINYSNKKGKNVYNPANFKYKEEKIVPKKEVKVEEPKKDVNEIKVDNNINIINEDDDIINEDDNPNIINTTSKSKKEMPKILNNENGKPEVINAITGETGEPVDVAPVIKKNEFKYFDKKTYGAELKVKSTQANHLFCYEKMDEILSKFSDSNVVDLIAKSSETYSYPNGMPNNIKGESSGDAIIREMQQLHVCLQYASKKLNSLMNKDITAFNESSPEITEIYMVHNKISDLLGSISKHCSKFWSEEKKNRYHDCNAVGNDKYSLIEHLCTCSMSIQSVYDRMTSHKDYYSLFVASNEFEAARKSYENHITRNYNLMKNDPYVAFAFDYLNRDSKVKGYQGLRSYIANSEKEFNAARKAAKDKNDYTAKEKDKVNNVYVVDNKISQLSMEQLKLSTDKTNITSTHQAYTNEHDNKIKEFDSKIAAYTKEIDLSKAFLNQKRLELKDIQKADPNEFTEAGIKAKMSEIEKTKLRGDYTFGQYFMDNETYVRMQNELELLKNFVTELEKSINEKKPAKEIDVMVELLKKDHPEIKATNPNDVLQAGIKLHAQKVQALAEAQNQINAKLYDYTDASKQTENAKIYKQLQELQEHYQEFSFKLEANQKKDLNLKNILAEKTQNISKLEAKLNVLTQGLENTKAAKNNELNAYTTKDSEVKKSLAKITKREKDIASNLLKLAGQKKEIEDKFKEYKAREQHHKELQAASEEKQFIYNGCQDLQGYVKDAVESKQALNYAVSNLSEKDKIVDDLANNKYSKETKDNLKTNIDHLKTKLCNYTKWLNLYNSRHFDKLRDSLSLVAKSIAKNEPTADIVKNLKILEENANSYINAKNKQWFHFNPSRQRKNRLQAANLIRNFANSMQTVYAMEPSPDEITKIKNNISICKNLEKDYGKEFSKKAVFNDYQACYLKDLDILKQSEKDYQKNVKPGANVKVTHADDKKPELNPLVK